MWEMGESVSDSSKVTDNYNLWRTIRAGSAGGLISCISCSSPGMPTGPGEGGLIASCIVMAIAA